MFGRKKSKESGESAITDPPFEHSDLARMDAVVSHFLNSVGRPQIEPAAAAIAAAAGVPSIESAFRYGVDGLNRPWRWLQKGVRLAVEEGDVLLAAKVGFMTAFFMSSIFPKLQKGNFFDIVLWECPGDVERAIYITCLPALECLDPSLVLAVDLRRDEEATVAMALQLVQSQLSNIARGGTQSGSGLL